MEKEKKSILKKWWFWVIVILIIIIATSGGTENSTNNTNTNENIVEETSLNEKPIIKGSQAYDVVLDLEQNGIPKPETQNQDDGYYWTAVTEEVSYSINANKKHEICYAEFMILNGKDDGFLAHCATIPYDTANSEEASQWVKDNIGKEATTKIGDANFKLSKGTQGAILEIFADGYEEYTLNQIQQMSE